MICTPNALMELAQQLQGIPQRALRSVMVYLACQWANSIPVPPVIGAPILSDGSGGFCELIVDIAGNVGAQASAGPATVPVPVIADGFGGFWKLVTDGACNRGTTPVAGPATAPVVLVDANLIAWTLITDAAGNLGATS